MINEKLVKISDLPLDGPSEQLLADGTRSTHVLVSLSASAVQYSLMSHAVQGRARSFDESESGGFIVDVDDQPSVPETFFPDGLCCVAW